MPIVACTVVVQALLWAQVTAVAHGEPVQVQTLDSSYHRGEERCVRCNAGDYQLSNGKLELIIGGSHWRDESFYKFPTAYSLGSIVFARPAGTGINGNIMAGTPYVRVDNRTVHVRYNNVDVRELPDRTTFTATGLYEGHSGTRAQFVAETSLGDDAERVSIVLSVTNTGHTVLDDFIYSLYFDPHQIYDFSPGDSEAHRGIGFRGYSRDNHLFAWVDHTPRRHDATDYNFGWDGGMILADPLAITLEPGESDSRKYTLIIAVDQASVLKNAYGESGVATHSVLLEFDNESDTYVEAIVRDINTSAIFYRGFLDIPKPLGIELPSGDYIVQVNFFPGMTECRLSVAAKKANRCLLVEPAYGKVSVGILDTAGNRIPGKVSFNGISPTTSPYFRPVNPTRDYGYWESHKNSVFPVDSDLEVSLPVGSYLVSATRGPEFSIHQESIQIAAGSHVALQFRIDRVIDRTDLVSVDSHLHTLESDGAVSVTEKIKAIVAADVDVAIATDHNFPVDYSPALQALKLQEHLIVVSGAEVTVPERLDYNTYPMVIRSNEYNHGAIDALSPDVGSRFRLSRARDAKVILQVNHPRLWQFDYFNWFELDADSAAFANAGFDTDFDVLEVVNGAIYDTPENRATRRDWFNLLRRGFYFPLVGTSDSHEIDQDEPGFSRTYVYRNETGDEPMAVDSLIAGLRQGRSFASNGPILDLKVNDRYRPGDTVTVAGGVAHIDIDVWTAAWIEADDVRIYVNGDARQLSTEPLPDAMATHRHASVELTLSSDAYVVAEVTGRKDLFPMLQRRTGSKGEETGVLPYALTNPVFIDVDGNGIFDPPLPHKIEIRTNR